MPVRLAAEFMPPLRAALLRSFAALTFALSATLATVLGTVFCTASAAGAPPMGADEARFFLTRTGFAPGADELAQYQHLSRQQAVDRVLQQTRTEASSAAPEAVRQSYYGPRQFKDTSEPQKKALRQLEAKQAMQLRDWWLAEMLATPSPLTERMTLFWHNHFVSSQQKVRHTKLMYEQNVLFRRYATGNFAELLHAVSKDPAMLLYLDSASNRKGSPNENFAREAMELFTLGEGRYGEQDVKQAARAYTGWAVDGETGNFIVRSAWHDNGVKQVLGQSGNFDGDAVLDILLAQAACADFIVDKLWREFVSPQPDPAEVRRIAQKFRNSHYEIKIALRELFLTPRFWDAGNRGSLVKSPVELLVGTLKQFQFHYNDASPFTYAIAQMGQNLFNPPNVKGWPGGDVWINSTTLLARKSVLERMFRTVESARPGGKPADRMMMAGGLAGTLRPGAPAADGGEHEGRFAFGSAAAVISFNPALFLAQYGNTPEVAPNVRQRLALQEAVLALEPSAPIRADLAGIAYLRTLVMDPVYQLK